MKKLITLIFIGILIPGYSVGRVISTSDQQTPFDVCYGEYPTDQLTFEDFEGKVMWINLSASW